MLWGSYSLNGIDLELAHAMQKTQLYHLSGPTFMVLRYSYCIAPLPKCLRPSTILLMLPLAHFFIPSHLIPAGIFSFVIQDKVFAIFWYYLIPSFFFKSHYSEDIQDLTFSLWLIVLNMISSSFFQVLVILGFAFLYIWLF